ncbi:annexin A11-like [Clupea harengus]|uniref:Annexin A11-like n=1 Tax=Clupea harengus TaxID=7950 RepID=A0A8M1KM22_CLUHA|nr:annexin A11-like [Clupea harengus]
MEYKAGWNPDVTSTSTPPSAPPRCPDGDGYLTGPPPPYQDWHGHPSAPPQYGGAGLQQPCVGVYPPPGGMPSPWVHNSSGAASPVPPDKFSPLHGQQPTVAYQQQVYTTQAPLEVPLPDYLAYSILTTICCFLPLGVAALMYSFFVSMSFLEQVLLLIRFTNPDWWKLQHLIYPVAQSEKLCLLTLLVFI